MNRRQFLTGAVATFAAAGVPSLFARAQDQSPAPIEVSIDMGGRLARVPDDFCGLSYESSQLADTSRFSPDNHDLIALFKQLSPNGVLRIGGNSSEYTVFGDTSTATDPASDTFVPPRCTLTTPGSLRNLAGFLQAVDWTLIYGLNLGTGNSGSAADEAAAVSRVVGDRLLAFQFGNEPDLFHRNGLRPPSWGYDDFYSEWSRYAIAVRGLTENARLAGPDVAGAVDWIERFALQARANKVSLLTGHYYAEGPPTNPAMNIERLLKPNSREIGAMNRIMAASRACGIPFRLSESNSCYMGGKLGVSNTFASALWIADTMLSMARNGCAGVNVHGGGHGIYTPIAGDPKAGYSVRPIFQGMSFAAAFAGADLLPVQFDAAGVNFTAYAARKSGETIVALINKDLAETARVSLRLDSRMRSPRCRQLSAPAVDATSDVMFAEVDPKTLGFVAGGDNACVFDLAPAGALLVTI
jgi:hypothetical protein